MSDDPDMKAIIVNQAVPGTTEAFRQIKEKRPDILCIAGESHEDPPESAPLPTLSSQQRAFFCTNDAHTEPLLKQLLEYGGCFVEADLPSPTMGYPGALGIDLTAEAGDYAKILAKVEKAVVEKGGAGRFGTWAYSYGYTVSAGLAQHALNVINGESELLDIDDISKMAYGLLPRR